MGNNSSNLTSEHRRYSLGNRLTIEIDPKTGKPAITKTPKDKYYDNSRACDAYDPIDEIKKKLLGAKKYNVVSSIEYGIVYFTIKWNLIKN